MPPTIEIRVGKGHTMKVPKGASKLLVSVLENAGISAGHFKAFMGANVQGSDHKGRKGFSVGIFDSSTNSFEMTAQPGDNSTCHMYNLYFPDEMRSNASVLYQDILAINPKKDRTDKEDEGDLEVSASGSIELEITQQKKGTMMRNQKRPSAKKVMQNLDDEIIHLILLEVREAAVDGVIGWRKFLNILREAKLDCREEIIAKCFVADGYVEAQDESSQPRLVISPKAEALIARYEQSSDSLQPQNSDKSVEFSMLFEQLSQLKERAEKYDELMHEIGQKEEASAQLDVRIMQLRGELARLLGKNEEEKEEIRIMRQEAVEIEECARNYKKIMESMQ